MMMMMMMINGSQLSDQTAILARWKGHFSELLSHPVPSPPPILIATAGEATVDEFIPTAPQPLLEVYQAIKKIREVTWCLCDISEYIHYTCSDAMKFVVRPVQIRLRICISSGRVAPEHNCFYLPCVPPKTSTFLFFKITLSKINRC